MLTRFARAAGRALEAGHYVDAPMRTRLRLLAETVRGARWEKTPVVDLGTVEAASLAAARREYRVGVQVPRAKGKEPLDIDSTGSSPQRTYELQGHAVDRGEMDFGDVTVLMQDEYHGLAG